MQMKMYNFAGQFVSQRYFLKIFLYHRLAASVLQGKDEKFKIKEAETYYYKTHLKLYRIVKMAD